MTAPSLRTLVKRVLRGHEDRTLLVAVSGGSDSSALLHVLSRVPGLRLFAHGVDHGLRPAAAGELARAAELAAALQVPFTTSTLHVAPGSNLQARARRARYEALERVRVELGAHFLVTAHHARDRAETVLLRLLRGAPAAGLGVLPVVEGTRLRPMIEAPKELILAHLARHGIAYAEDPSNEDPRFLRVRVRRELLPLLRSLAPGIETTLCRLADAHAAPDTTHREDLALLHALPRASLEALRRLSRERSATAEVWLPGGLAARAAGPHVEIRAVRPARSRGPIKSRSILP